MNRRKYLSGLCGSTLLLSGCLSDGAPVPGLREVRLANDLDEERSLDVKITREEEMLYSESHDVQTVGYVSLEEEWMGDTGDYELTGSLTDGQEKVVTTATLAERFDPGKHGCFSILFQIHATGQLGTYVTSTTCDR